MFQFKYDHKFEIKFARNKKRYRIFISMVSMIFKSKLQKFELIQRLRQHIHILTACIIVYQHLYKINKIVIIKNIYQTEY